MGVARDIGEGMVLAVYADPLARPYPGHEPDQDPEGRTDRRAQVDRAVRQGPVQVDSRAEKRYLAESETHKHGDKNSGHRRRVSA